MYACKLLTSEELFPLIRLGSDNDALDLSPGITESQLLHLCNNLLVMDPQRKTWMFCHLADARYPRQGPSACPIPGISRANETREQRQSRDGSHTAPTRRCRRRLTQDKDQHYPQRVRGVRNSARQFFLMDPSFAEDHKDADLATIK